MLIDKELPVSCSHVTDYFFFNSMVVTVHIIPTAPHHTTVLTVSVKKNSTTRSFTRVISVRLLKNLAKDGTLAKSGLLPYLKIVILIILKISQFLVSLKKNPSPLKRRCIRKGDAFQVMENSPKVNPTKEDSHATRFQTSCLRLIK